MDEERLWKRRFHMFLALRVGGLAIFFLGIGIAFTDLVRDGGWMAVGMVVAALGLIDAVFAPRVLKKQWDKG